MQKIDHDYQIRLVLTGNTNVGKSCIQQRFAKDIFDGKCTPTIGVDYERKSIEIDNKSIYVNLYDTAGLEQFQSITQSYFKYADGVVIVYDVTDPLSFQDIQNKWIPQIQDLCDKETKFIIVGNKADLEEQREVCYEMANQLAQQYKCKYYETSAKTDFQIKSIFQSIIKDVYFSKIKLNKEERSKKINLNDIQIKEFQRIQKPNKQQFSNNNKSSSCC